MASSILGSGGVRGLIQWIQFVVVGGGGGEREQEQMMGGKDEILHEFETRAQGGCGEGLANGAGRVGLETGFDDVVGVGEGAVARGRRRRTVGYQEGEG